MQTVLSGILFCFILLLCFASFFTGAVFGGKYIRKKCAKSVRQSEPLTQQQIRQLELSRRQTENFYKYDGTAQRD